MAKSKSLAKNGDQAADTSSAIQAKSKTHYQLDQGEVERATRALVVHMKKNSEKGTGASVKNLADDEDEAGENDQPVFLSVSTKKHVHTSNSLKPSKINLPHPYIANNVRICLFTKDPQRAYKDLVASDAFPAVLRAKIRRVLGIEKLKKRYKTYEQKRALSAEYDIFMVDDRVIKIVAEFLGKSFYKSKAKRPIPVRLTAGAWVDKTTKKDVKEPLNLVGTPQGVAKEIETALNSTYLSLSASMNTSIKIGILSQTPQQLSENITAAVTVLTSKHIPQGWRNVRALYIKGPSTKALPVWDADQLWADDAQVLDGPHIGAITDGGRGKSAEKKRKWEEWEEEMLDDEQLAAKKAQRDAKKAKKAQKKGSVSKEKRKALKDEALQSVQTPLIAG